MSESGGLLESLKRLSTTLITIVQTRLELLSNEIEEERLRISLILLYSCATLFFFGLFVITLTVSVVLCFWDSHPILVLSSFCVLYFALSLWAITALLQVAKHRPKLFSTSLAELSADLEKLGPRP